VQDHWWVVSVSLDLKVLYKCVIIIIIIIIVKTRVGKNKKSTKRFEVEKLVSRAAIRR